MATITRENIGLLNDKLTVLLAKEDYFSAYEKNLKNYAKNASIPGFRKGMVPTGLIKKMYGQNVFTDEILKTAEKELQTYLEKEQLKIFGQPLPLDIDALKLDINNPTDYSFTFEIGLTPEVNIDTTAIKVTRYVIAVSDSKIDEAVEHDTNQHGKLVEQEAISADTKMIAFIATETNEAGEIAEGTEGLEREFSYDKFNEEYKTILIGKKKDDTINVQLSKAFELTTLGTVCSNLGIAGQESAGTKFYHFKIVNCRSIEKAAIDEDLFKAVYPNKEITTEAEYRDAIKHDLSQNFAAQSRNQVHDQIYHHLTDHTKLEFPEAFLKRLLKASDAKEKTTEEIEKEFPPFLNSLKWSLIMNQLIYDNKIEVTKDEIKAFGVNQLMGYFGGHNFADQAPWLDTYINKMMQDKKFVEDTYQRIQSEKLFAAIETQVSSKDEAISEEDFAKKLHHHHH